MKTMLLAAAAALSLGIGSAYADSVRWHDRQYLLHPTSRRGPQTPAQNVPAAATAQGGAHAYVTQSSHGTWLFPPHEGGGTNG